MKSFAKKIIICSLAGLLQTGLFVFVVQAEPATGEQPRFEQQNEQPQLPDQENPPKKEHENKQHQKNQQPPEQLPDHEH